MSFEKLFNLLNNSKYEIDADLKNFIKQVIEESGFCSQPLQIIVKQPEEAQSKNSLMASIWCLLGIEEMRLLILGLCDLVTLGQLILVEKKLMQIVINYIKALNSRHYNNLKVYVSAIVTLCQNQNEKLEKKNKKKFANNRNRLIPKISAELLKIYDQPPSLGDWNIVQRNPPSKNLVNVGDISALSPLICVDCGKKAIIPTIIIYTICFRKPCRDGLYICYHPQVFDIICNGCDMNKRDINVRNPYKSNYYDLKVAIPQNLSETDINQFISERTGGYGYWEKYFRGKPSKTLG